MIRRERGRSLHHISCSFLPHLPKGNERDVGTCQPDPNTRRETGCRLLTSDPRTLDSVGTLEPPPPPPSQVGVGRLERREAGNIPAKIKREQLLLHPVSPGGHEGALIRPLVEDIDPPGDEELRLW
ncbi:hypothetical protein E2C01_082890 [Portunus trituberculatus]|uniref:Uncharacterized protein n=1 Tax=Portunus trituberculatus TaxID=210409 RepID=A0A5B7IR24_PORTR|nr:hypothetical protein [Portunus trituberculatus]